MPLFRFRILRGSHRVGPKKGPDGTQIEAGKNYKAGDIVETTVDLAEKFPSVPPKFQRIDIVEELEKDLAEQLRAMSRNELIAKAAADEINIDGCNTKEAIIDAFVRQLS